MNELEKKVVEGLTRCQTVNRAETPRCDANCPYHDIGEIQSDCMNALINDIYTLYKLGKKS